MISIIIPAYNSRATIVEALESVASQTLWSQLAVGSEQLAVGSEEARSPEVKRMRILQGEAPVVTAVTAVGGPLMQVFTF